MTDIETARYAAKKSAHEAFSQLPATETERSRHANGLDTIPGGWYQNEMRWLEGELGREPTEEEENEYVSVWEETIQELKEEE